MSLKNWQADFGGIDYGSYAKGDLVAVNKIVVAECYNDWPNGMEADVEIKGWNTDADHYAKIYAPAGQHHNSVDYNSGFWIKETHGWASGISIGAPYTKIEGIGFFPKTQGSGGIGVGNGINDVRIDSCIFKNNNRTYKAIGIFTGGNTNNFVISNCIFQGLDTGISASGYTANGRILNSIAVGCNTGFYQGKDGDKTAINNSIAYKNIVSNWSNVDTWHMNSTNNASNEATDESIPGSNSVTEVTDSDFVNYALNDFHLSETSKLRGKGVDFSDIVTNDIDAQTRKGLWDIGIDEIEGESYIPGDVNGDGKADILDVQALVNYLLDPVKYPQYAQRVDVNGDEKIDVSDVQEMVNKLLGD